MLAHSVITAPVAVIHTIIDNFVWITGINPVMTEGENITFILPFKLEAAALRYAPAEMTK